MSREILRRTISFLSAFLFVIAIEKWVVDACLPEEDFRIFPKWASAPESVCEPVVRWDMNIRRSDAYKQSTLPLFVDREFHGAVKASNEKTSLMDLALSRPTIVLQKFPGWNANTFRLLAEILSFSFGLALFSYILGESLFARSGKNVALGSDAPESKYHIRPPDEVAEKPFRPNRSLRHRDE